MKMSRKVQPVGLPITVANAKSHAVIQHCEDDTLISMQISQAVDYAEQHTGRKLMTQTWEVFFDAWHLCFEVPLFPIQSVTITYTDEAGDEQTLASDQYQVDTQSYPAIIRPAPDVTWPDLQDNYNTVKVDVVCGYDAACDVPHGIKAAIYLMVGHLYANREGSTPAKIAEVPYGIDAFLDQYKLAFLS